MSNVGGRKKNISFSITVYLQQLRAAFEILADAGLAVTQHQREIVRRVGIVLRGRLAVGLGGAHKVDLDTAPELVGQAEIEEGERVVVVLARLLVELECGMRVLRDAVSVAIALGEVAACLWRGRDCVVG